jgi:uncharacterized protein YkwD
MTSPVLDRRRRLVAVGALAAMLWAATAAAADEDARIARLEQELLRRVNAERRQRGLPALTRDPALARVARDYSCRMVAERFFSHQPPDGSTLADRVRAAGKPYRAIGENIAMNVNAADPVATAVQGWMKSPGHRENILSPVYTQTGLGICRRNGTYYFTELFLRPPS